MSEESNPWLGIVPTDEKMPTNVLQHLVELFNNAFSQKMAIVVEPTVDYNPSTDTFDMIMDSISKENLYRILKVVLHVPGLSSYRMTVLRLSYPISSPYPCEVEDYIGEDSVKHNYTDAKTLDSGLREILTSEQFLAILRNLLAQI